MNNSTNEIHRHVETDIHYSNLYDFIFPKLEADKEKQQAIKEAFLFAWYNYKRYAWGKDFLSPISKKGFNVFSGGLTITDSLDTLLVMGLYDEFNLSRSWVLNNFTLGTQKYSVFEIIIRHLCSFLTTYQQTHDSLFLEKAIFLADSLLPVFETNSGYFRTYVSFHQDNKGTFHAESHGNIECLLSDLGSIQLEFYTLSLLSGDPKYAKIASKIHKNLFIKYPNEGLLPERINTKDGSSMSDIRSVDSMSDSFYEYLIKIYLMTHGTQSEMLNHYLLTTNDIKTKLLTKNGNWTWLTRTNKGNKDNMMTHLVTFAAGMFAIGSVKKNPNAIEDLKLADELATTYYKLYKSQKSGLMPECVRINGENVLRSCDPYYKLRPETIESLFVLYRFTGLKKYRDYAWDIFNSIIKSCKVENGFATLKNVDNDMPLHEDIMDSYFLAETLKYLYLIFSPSDLIPTAKYVFNTEAHYLKVWNVEEANKMKDIIGMY